MIAIVGKDSSVVKRVTCRNCSSVLEYTPAEEQRDYTSDYLGYRDYYSYIVCPCCGKQAKTKDYWYAITKRQRRSLRR